MSEIIWVRGAQSFHPTALRDVRRIAKRYRYVGWGAAALVLLAGLGVAFLLPRYKAETSILVRHDRVDPVVSSRQDGASSPEQGVTDADINSECELLTSNDLLENVAILGGKASKGGDATAQRKLARAVRQLKSHLSVARVGRSNLIRVEYSSSDPREASETLNHLTALYLQKHVEVHRPAVQHGFFEQQAESYKRQMESAEAKLKEFQGAAPQVMRDATSQKLAEFHSTLELTKSGIAEAQQRIRNLEGQAGNTPQRITTISRRSDNPQLLQNLKTQLLNLNLKRTELVTKYQPTYRLVQEVDNQIADTKAAIAAEESAPIKDITTDENPVQQWIRSELARTRAELKALEARKSSVEAAINDFHEDAHNYDVQSLDQQDLARDLKTAEDNYLLYTRKAEETRISEAMDQKRILNVAVSDPASTPVLPAHSRTLILLSSVLLAFVVGAGAVFLANHFDPRYRSRDEVYRSLSLPLLAAIPEVELSRPGASMGFSALNNSGLDG